MSQDEHHELAALNDCDHDGTLNAYDLDSDNDGKTDAEETQADDDQDGMANACDPDDSDGPTADGDGDGIENGVETSLGTSPYSIDTDDDGISDSIETLGGTQARDTDTDGKIDALDTDSDGDGIADGVELNTIDSDEDGIPNYRDPDDDQDGLPTALEYALGLKLGFDIDGDSRSNHLDNDSDGDTEPDSVESFGDVDGDGIADFLDADDTNGAFADQDVDGLSSAQEYRLGSMPTRADSDGDGVLDGDELGSDANNPLDSDGDQIPDIFDEDDDNDSISTADEVATGAALGSTDPDGDGIPSWLDLDSDGDGQSDMDEANLDADEDGLPDYLDDDRDNDGVPDDLDNCPDHHNPEQSDYDGDSTGDACDPPESICDDGVDDDDDGDIDCDDFDCYADPICGHPRLGKGYTASGSSCAQTSPAGFLWLLIMGFLVKVFYKRRHSHYLVLLVLAGGITLQAPSARAQTDSIDLDPFADLPSSLSTVGNIATSTPVSHMKLSLGASLKYSDTPLSISLASGAAGDENSRVPSLTRILGSQVRLELSAILGLFDWADVGVAIPTISNFDVNGQSLGRLNTELKGYGMGDMRLFLRTRLHPDKALGQIGLALVVVAHLPTGNPLALHGEGVVHLNLPRDPETYPQQEGSLRVEPRLVADVEIEGARVAVNVGYQIRPSVQSFDAVASNGLTYGVALESPIWNRWRFAGTFSGSTSSADAIDPMDSSQTLAGQNNSPSEISLFATHEDESGIQYTVGAHAGLRPAMGSSKLRISAGLRYAFDVISTDPAYFDTDGDGLRDGLDNCPGNPEDSDGFADDDGCPELDNDLDGIPDDIDKCPDLSEDLDGFEDSDGCNDPDNDADDIPDVIDECPGQPEDRDGFEDSDGCPEIDNDYDGVIDADDKCPMDAEDVDGFADEDGCPELDNDEDGTLDANDSCPSDPTDRCIAARQGDFIRFHGKILFKVGKAVLLSQSLGIIEAVIEVLRNSEDIRMVEIRGHTDSTGTPIFNRKLSQARAETVMAYMVQAGISAKRLRAVGYGEEKSLRSNDSQDGRAVNRRVEFQIIRID